MASEQPRPPLRRATYVKISDLTSAYNLDHVRLEQELNRVSVCREAKSGGSSPRSGSPATSGTPPSDVESAFATLSQKRLQPPRGGFNLCVLVGALNVVVDKRRVDRSRVRLAEVEVGDETGTVSLRARDDQIDVLQEVAERSGAVVLRNSTLELFQGKHIRLAITKWGKLSPYPDEVASTPPPPTRLNRNRNFSMIDLSLVVNESSQEAAVSLGLDPEKSFEEGRGAVASRQPQYSTNQPQGKKSGRSDRRTSRTRTSGVNPLARQYAEGSLHGEVRYSPGIQGFSGGYGDPRQFSYHRQPEGMAPAGAHHSLIMQQQQYEMRHMHQQMYHDHAHDRQMMPLSQVQHVQPPSLVSMSDESFDSPPDYHGQAYAGSPSDHASAMPSQLLMPMSIGGASSYHEHFPPALSRTEKHGSTGKERLKEAVPPRRSSKSGPDSPRNPTGAWGAQPSSGMRAESPLSLMKMNPQATAFAPAYMPSQGTHTHQNQPGAFGYVPYGTVQGVVPGGGIYSSPVSPHHHMYPQDMTYGPTGGARTLASVVSHEAGEEHTPQHHAPPGNNQDTNITKKNRSTTPSDA